MACPTGVKTEETTFHGEWEDEKCKACSTNISGSGCLCVVFKVYGCPFSCTPVAPAGPGVYANYQGFCISYDGTDMYSQWLCAKGKLIKKEPKYTTGGAPPAVQMER